MRAERMRLRKSLIALAAGAALSACGSQPGIPRQGPFGAPQRATTKEWWSKLSATYATPGLLYWAYLGDGVQKLRLSDGKAFSRKSYGNPGAVDLAINKHRHVLEAYYAGHNSSALVELNSHLKIVRTVNI